MRVFVCVFISLSTSLSSDDDVDALLLYEDQRDGSFVWEETNINFLTLKKKIHQEKKEFADLTVCYRINVLSHKEFSTVLQLRTDKYVKMANPETGQTFFQTNYMHATFGVWYGVCLMSFPDFQYEVLGENGIYVLLPELETLNANQWHSICTGFDFLYCSHFSRPLRTNSATLYLFQRC